MDIHRPSQAFAVPPLSSTQDVRRWLRLVALSLAGAIALGALMGLAR